MAELKTSQEQTPTAEDALEEEWYDLLPIEKKLIKYSLSLGIGLLIVFVIVFRVIPDMM